MHFSMQRTPAWARDARKLIKRTYGKGWVVRPQRSGRVQILREWNDGTSSSCTVDLDWSPTAIPQLLALIERLVRMTGPVVDGGGGLPLAKAAAMIRLEDSGGSVNAIRSGAVDWSAVLDSYRRHRVDLTGELSATTWQRRHRLFCNEALALLSSKRAPKDGPGLLAALIREHPTAAGGSGRKERVASVAGLLEFAVKQCGADDRWLPPADRKDLIGKRADRKPEGVALLDDQGLRIYRAISDPQWRLAWGLMVCFGIRPVEIGCCRVDGDCLLVKGVKRNRSGKSADRRVWALDPIGFDGMGASLLSLLKDRGRSALHADVKSAYWSTRVQQHLRRFVPEWEELVADAAAAGQGHLTVYSCRHGYAFRGTQLGLDYRTLSRLMGHDPSTHLKHYGRWTNEESVAAAVASAVAKRRDWAEKRSYSQESPTLDR